MVKRDILDIRSLEWIDTTKDVRRALEARREELSETHNTSMRAVSMRAGFCHANYWGFLNRGAGMTLEAALCYLRALGLRVVLVPDTPLVPLLPPADPLTDEAGA